MLSSVLAALGASLAVSKYILLVPGAFIEGISASVIAGSLVRIGIYEFWLAYFCLMAGKLIGDVAWYWVGYHFGEPFIKKAGKYVRLTEPDIDVAKDLFRRYQDGVLFFSKLTMGLGLAIVILFTAGVSKMNFWRYMLFNALGEALWTGALLVIGYYFGDMLLSTSDMTQRSLIVAFYAAGFFLLLAAGHFARKHIVAARERKLLNPGRD